MPRGRPPLDENSPLAKDLASVAARVQQARAFRGLGSRELAARAGLSEATVSSIETGHVKGIELLTCLRIADALGVRRAWLLTGEGHADAGSWTG